MFGKLRKKLEDWMAAAAFAEADDEKTAREIIGRSKRPRKTMRPRARREKRAELRAPGPRM
jgi:hypothetical protein